LEKHLDEKPNDWAYIPAISEPAAPEGVMLFGFAGKLWGKHVMQFAEGFAALEKGLVFGEHVEL